MIRIKLCLGLICLLEDWPRFFKIGHKLSAYKAEYIVLLNYSDIPCKKFDWLSTDVIDTVPKNWRIMISSLVYDIIRKLNSFICGEQFHVSSLAINITCQRLLRHPYKKVQFLDILVPKTGILHWFMIYYIYICTGPYVNFVLKHSTANFVLIQFTFDYYLNLLWFPVEYGTP